MTDDKPILKEGIFPGLESFAKSWEESREKAKEEAKKAYDRFSQE